jgi:histidinol-phosphate aminotransferase
MTYERPGIRRLQAYTPGEQPRGGGVIKLNTNENPYPPAPEVLAALGDIDPHALRRYPSPMADEFRQVAARLHGVEPANIIATNGGDELLRLALTCFVEPGEAIGVTRPSYSLYPVLANIHGATVFEVPRPDDWQLPKNFAAQLNAHKVRLGLVVNPHAPSGRLSPASELADIAAELNGVLLIDEAYVDFVDPDLAHTTLPLIQDFDNVLILRTLSKGYSLAGLRFGYGIGNAELIAGLHKVRDSYNQDVISQALAVAALGAQGHAQSNWQRVRDERQRLAREFGQRGMSAPPSQANFLLVNVPTQANAQDLYKTLKQQNILVRWFVQPRLQNKLRISIGTVAENGALLAAVDGYLQSL